MLTLGIAGHVDHGKTSLVRALTGIETDRLPEEQRRGISIELGFAWLDVQLPDGVQDPGGRPTRIGLVDMPGHERFVRRMISGASGVDAVLLVIAADEGVMPQGREHLAICRLLGVEHGAVVVTKADLADAFLLDMVRDDVAGLVEGTFLQGAPVWPCSARDSASIEGLRRNIAAFAADLRIASRARAAASEGRPFRLAVDRSFVLHGRGTVVAGTASAGRVAVDDVVRVLPGDASFRVRSLEQHGHAATAVAAPGRVALNLAGASVGDVAIGSVLVGVGAPPPTHRFDARLHLLAHPALTLPARQRAMLHLGTTQVEAVLVQLTGEPQLPGTDALVQVHLDRKLAVAPGEGFVVRGSQVDPRHGQTFAGGKVLHPRPPRHRLRDPAVLALLADLEVPRVETQLAALAALAGIRGETDADLQALIAAPPLQVMKAIKGLLADGRLRRAGTPPRCYAPAALVALEQRALHLVTEFHRNQPTRPGIEPDHLHRLLGAWLEPTATAHVIAGLVRRGALAQPGAVLALPTFQPKATARPEVVAAVVQALTSQGLASALPAVLADELAIELRELTVVLQAAVAAGQLVRIAEDHHATPDNVREAVAQVLEAFGTRDSFTTGELKDLLGLTRKHLIPFAEYLDAERVTVRDPSGNRRVRDKAREAWLAGRLQPG